MSLSSTFVAPSTCVVSGGVMRMSGLPVAWVIAALAGIAGLTLWAILTPVRPRTVSAAVDLARWPVVGYWIARLTRTPWVLIALKITAVAAFLLVIAAGLFGTPMPRQNISTLLTWNLWWTGVVFSVFFLGSVWCAVCPWDTLATWLVNRRLWRRPDISGSLDLPVPSRFRTVWIATIAFIFLSWLELGYGLTAAPYATALLALFIVLSATASAAVFQKKAFCRYFCPVGRTIGAYAQLAPLALRPREPDICARCRTLECYHGSVDVSPCPTSLVMGRIQENTYCLSCGNCTLSCPNENVGWRLRPASQEAMMDARPHADEAWFMLVLLTITLFHGFTMLDSWETILRQLGVWLDDSGRLIASFTIAMLVLTSIPVLLYMAIIAFTRSLSKGDYREIFTALAFLTLPLSFGYHLAHNLMHLNSETHGVALVFGNPLGFGAQPLSSQTIQNWMNDPLFNPFVLHLLQTVLIMFGYWLAMLVLRHRAHNILPNIRRHGWPLIIFCLLVTVFQLWMLSQPMSMRFQ